MDGNYFPNSYTTRHYHFSQGDLSSASMQVVSSKDLF